MLPRNQRGHSRSNDANIENEMAKLGIHLFTFNFISIAKISFCSFVDQPYTRLVRSAINLRQNQGDSNSFLITRVVVIRLDNFHGSIIISHPTSLNARSFNHSTLQPFGLYYHNSHIRCYIRTSSQTTGSCSSSA